MAQIQIFESAMCCSTGVCGPSPDQSLIRFSADVEWLRSQGIIVERNNLSQQPQAFAANQMVRDLLEAQGTACLPLILIDGTNAFQGAYPTRQELASRLSLNAADTQGPSCSLASKKNLSSGSDCCSSGGYC